LLQRPLLFGRPFAFLEVAMIAELLVIFVMPALLAAAAGWDLASYTIPNFLSVALIAAFGAFALVIGMTPGAIGLHGLAGALALAIGFVLFALGYVGGGDAKLFGAIVLWLGFGNLLDFAFLVSLFGGALALLLLSLRRWPLPAALMEQGWLARLHDSRSGIPYGIALAAAALVLLPHTDIFRRAVTG
jgi:prepilin peptidase CpaA